MAFPLAAIISIAIGLYVLIMVAVVLIYYCMRDRIQCCGSQCCVKSEGSQPCCVALSESCNCCESPSLKSCLKSCCPNRKHITCVDILMCQCCASEGPSFWELVKKKQISSCTKKCCKKVDSETCNCMCFEIRLVNTPPHPSKERAGFFPVHQSSNAKSPGLPMDQTFHQQSLPAKSVFHEHDRMLSLERPRTSRDWMRPATHMPADTFVASYPPQHEGQRNPRVHSSMNPYNEMTSYRQTGTGSQHGQLPRNMTMSPRFLSLAMTTSNRVEEPVSFMSFSAERVKRSKKSVLTKNLPM